MALAVDLGAPTCLRCPECGSVLRASGAKALVCLACGTTWPIEQGLVMLGRGEARPMRPFSVPVADLRAAAGSHWPAAFGMTIEIGAGVAGMTAALAAEDSVSDLIVINASAEWLGRNRDVAGRIAPVLVVADDAGGCLADVCANTIVGTVPSRSRREARLFLNQVYRALRPGGRALFIEPNPLFQRRFKDGLSVALSRLLQSASELEAECHRLLAWLAHRRRALMAHEGTYLLTGFEAHRGFMRQAVIDHARTLGFQRVDLRPVPRQGAMAAAIAAVAGEMGIGAAMQQAVEAHLRQILPGGDDPIAAAPHLLLSLTKPKGPHVRLFELPSWPSIHAGSVAGRWVLRLRPRRTDAGFAIATNGWCLLDRDAVSLRVTAGGTIARAPIWRPRPDVYQAVNGDGRYPAWNAMCCGVDDDLPFPGVRDDGAGVPITVQIEFADGMTAVIQSPDRVSADVPVQLTG
jgi:hypothetical protein